MAVEPNGAGGITKVVRYGCAMSDTPQGPGWWYASDGRWYPPEASPIRGQATPQPGQASPQPGQATPQPGQATPGWGQAAPHPGQAQQPPHVTQAAAVEQAGWPAPWVWWSIVGAGAAAILGAVLPWGRVVSVFGTISVSGIDGGDGWITMLCGVAILALALVGRTRNPGPYAIAGLVASAIVLLVGLVDFVDLSRAAGDQGTGGFVDVRFGIGLPLTVLGGLVGIAATILALLPVQPAVLARRPG